MKFVGQESLFMIKDMKPFDPWDNFSVGRKLDYEIIRTGVTVYERILQAA